MGVKIQGPEYNGIEHQTPKLTIRADLNFDGDFEDANEIFETEFSGSGGLIEVEHSYTVIDDGPAPGDQLPVNQMRVEAKLGNNAPITQFAEVRNLPPQFNARPTLTMEMNANNQSVAVFTASIKDDGGLDSHQLTVSWPDGVSVTTNDTVNELDPEIGPVFQKPIQLRYVIPESRSSLLPLTLTIRDDDTGEATYQMSTVDVGVNDDDDNESGIKDLAEFQVDDEDDLIRLDRESIFEYTVPDRQGAYVLQYDPTKIRIWDSEEKTNLILPTNYFPFNASQFAYSLDIGVIAYTGQSAMWVEGLEAGSASIALDWYDNIWNHSYLYGGTVSVVVWGLDLDIDSDNDNGFNYPEGDDWESI